LNSEARCIITDHEAFVLMNVYFPNDSGPERSTFRMNFYKAIEAKMKDIVELQGRSIILVGDLNTTCYPIDHCDYSRPFRDLNPDRLVNDSNQLKDDYDKLICDYLLNGESEEIPLIVRDFYEIQPSRAWIYRLLHRPSPFIDLFRKFHPTNPEKYTCWNTRVSARPSNYGTRLDYVIVGGPLWQIEGMIRGCEAWDEFMGSDHCPVVAEFDIPMAKGMKKDEIVLPSLFIRQHCNQSRIDQFFKPCPTVSEKRPFILQSEEKMLEKSSSHVQSVLGNPKPAPLCRGHREPCKLLKTTKKGPNQGRDFWICSRLTGHASDPESRCNHFEWRRNKQ